MPRFELHNLTVTEEDVRLAVNNVPDFQNKGNEQGLLHAGVVVTGARPAAEIAAAAAIQTRGTDIRDRSGDYAVGIAAGRHVLNLSGEDRTDG